MSKKTFKSADKKSIEFLYNKVYDGGVLDDVDNGFIGASSLDGARLILDNKEAASLTGFNEENDLQAELLIGSKTRMVNVSGGMAYTVPTAVDKVDYTLAKYRVKSYFDDCVLIASSEYSNPYGDRPRTWEIYRDEWLLRWINDDDYILKNGLKRLQPVIYADTAFKEGHEVYMYSVYLGDSDRLVYPYYSVGVIRRQDDLINFGLFVLKSKTEKFDCLKSVLKSYSRLDRKGGAKHYYSAGNPKSNQNWNEETKRCYELMNSSDKVDWGVFSYSMPGNNDALKCGDLKYDEYLNKSKAMKKGIEEIWGHRFDIYPTYTHFGFDGNPHYFPVNMANELAGGNGVNGKPILQFTFQYTLNNNIVAENVTPMFDILRGKFDDYFVRLSRDIKAYGKPVLFRLNNEMNTDWTSYSGMMTLLDPDIFVETWKYLYHFFDREGVDNAMWIWNPIEKSCPYSSWGEDLCFNPGSDYVHFLGLTSYEMNNGDKTESFKLRYKRLYDKNAPVWGKFKAIISEFACGSGGESSGKLDRNRESQAAWVREMFDCLNAKEKESFAAQIVGAVWFNCDDSDATKIYNRLRFFDPTYKDNDHATAEAFRQGFKQNK